MSTIKQNKQQRKAITHGRHPLMVVAGPGSGKTFVITERICYILDELGADPASVLVVTFSRAAAQQMRDRFVAKYTERHPEHVLQSSSESRGTATPRRTSGRAHADASTQYDDSTQGRGFGNSTGRPCDYKKVTFATFHSFFYHILLTAYGKGAERYIFPDGRTSGTIMDDADSRGDGSKFSDAQYGQYGSNASVHHDAHPKARAAGTYHYECDDDSSESDQDTIRFDEMIKLTEELLTSREDIRKAIKTRYKWILIDEFQDIDPEQYRIVRLITDKSSNLTIVGDDDQSIYAFRGSDPSIMLNFRKDYPGAKKVILNTNYRSTSEIVDASQRVIRHNKNRLAKNLRSASGRGGIVSVTPCMNITDEIEKLYAAMDICLKHGIPMSDMAILYRTNFQPRSLLLLFEEMGVDTTGLNMMTFHTSKGLEWPIVFILDVNEGVTPHRKSKTEQALEEERRAFYVAMTRAKKELHMFYCLRRYEKKSPPSPYLTEMQTWWQRIRQKLGSQ